jgi:hypothetical protein
MVVNQLRLNKQHRKVEKELNSQNARFVKYIGFTDSDNLVFVQDIACTNYYFTSTSLTLVRKMAE